MRHPSDRKVVCRGAAPHRLYQLPFFAVNRSMNFSSLEIGPHTADHNLQLCLGIKLTPGKSINNNQYIPIRVDTLSFFASPHIQSIYHAKYLSAMLSLYSNRFEACSNVSRVQNPKYPKTQINRTQLINFFIIKSYFLDYFPSIDLQ